MTILNKGDWCQQSCDKQCDKGEKSMPIINYGDVMITLHNLGCIQTPSGPQCYCKEGYKLKEDESSCEDIDECLLFGSCSQSSLCKNKDGGHDCSCMVG